MYNLNVQIPDTLESFMCVSNNEFYSARHIGTKTGALGTDVLRWGNPVLTKAVHLPRDAQSLGGKSAR